MPDLVVVGGGVIGLSIAYELAGQDEAELIVTLDGIASAPVRVPIVATKAGLYPVVFNQDFSINSAEKLFSIRTSPSTQLRTRPQRVAWSSCFSPVRE